MENAKERKLRGEEGNKKKMEGNENRVKLDIIFLFTVSNLFYFINENNK